MWDSILYRMASHKMIILCRTACHKKLKLSQVWTASDKNLNLCRTASSNKMIILCRTACHKKFKFVQDGIQQYDNFMQDGIRQKIKFVQDGIRQKLMIILCRIASNKKFIIKFVQIWTASDKNLNLCRTASDKNYDNFMQDGIPNKKFKFVQDSIRQNDNFMQDASTASNNVRYYPA